jgi:Transposase
MVFVGIDWAEDRHDVCLLDEQCQLLGRLRVPEGLEGARRLHELVAEHTGAPERVVVGIETDRGLLVQALVAAGYQVLAINPLSVARSPERYSTSGAKSDAGDAELLADLVRTDRHKHRPPASPTGFAVAPPAVAAVLAGLLLDLARLLEALHGLHGDGGPLPVGQGPPRQIEGEHVRGGADPAAGGSTRRSTPRPSEPGAQRALPHGEPTGAAGQLMSDRERRRSP